MLQRLTILLMILGGSASADQVVWPIIDGGNGHLYDIIPDIYITYSDAEGAAVDEGGHLVSITSLAEQMFLESLLETRQMASGGYWIGLQETQEEGVYEWLTGEPIVYANWADDEPNNLLGSENKVHMLWTLGANESTYYRRGGWNDAPSAGYGSANFSDIMRAGYIIEVVPEPATMVLLAFGALALLRRRRLA